ncbi:MAG: hypothetical protein COC04_01090 [Gammaproteobacteria bacterium]|nr:DUF2927 domain-containing protein [Pseudomonadota bacterium]PCH65763.1 MAG: hypothetical protein COC04_01090 [Gammaproteobacteria bacterium]
MDKTSFGSSCNIKGLRTTISSLLIMLTLAWSSSVIAIHWHANEYITNSFVAVTLSEKSQDSTAGIKKWQKPIYYEIKHHIDDIELHERLVALHFSQIRDITGLKIQPADQLHPANLTIVLTSEKRYQQDIAHYFKLDENAKTTKEMAKKIGSASLFTRRDNSIQQAAVVIPTDRARAEARLLATLSEMLTQVLGFPNRSTSVYPSVLNDRARDHFLSGLDYLMLKILYDDRVQSGMSSIKTRETVNQIIAERSFQDQIKTAELVVKQQGLYPLLN